MSFVCTCVCLFLFFFQAEDGIRDPEMSRGLGRRFRFCPFVIVHPSFLSLPFVPISSRRSRQPSGTTAQMSLLGHCLPPSSSLPANLPCAELVSFLLI